ncbi:MAG: Spy/CpxP family protein refolding chaperone [Candidatus Brocadiia bacterium]
MRKYAWIGMALALALAAPLARAGGPPDRGRRDRGRRFRGFDPRRMFGRETNVFRTVQRYFDLTEEQGAAIEKLDRQRDAEEREAVEKLRDRLDEKYVGLIIEVLPDEQKEKYQAVIDAMKARDEAIDAAREKYAAVLEEVRTEQGVEPRYPPGYVPTQKTDLVRRYLKLTEDQEAAVDEVRRQSFREMRELMRDIPRPDDWRDEAARRKFMEAVTKARDEHAEKTVKDMLVFLTEEQKKTYETAATALDEYRKTVDAAREACEKKLIELLGEEAVRGRPDRPRNDDEREGRERDAADF